MGMSTYSYTGYGLVIVDEDIDEEDFTIPEGINVEYFGDHVLGEGCGIFFKVKHMPITADFDTEEYLDDYVVEYKISSIDLSFLTDEIRDWLNKTQAENSDTSHLGVFMVTYFG